MSTHVWDVRDLALAACSRALALESSGQVFELSQKKFWKSDSAVWRARLTTACGPQNWDKVIPTGIKLSRTQVEALDTYHYSSRDATGGKFPLNSRGKFRCCFCQLFEILVRLEIPLDFHAWSRISNFAESTVRLLNLIRRARIMHVV